MNEIKKYKKNQEELFLRSQDFKKATDNLIISLYSSKLMNQSTVSQIIVFKNEIISKLASHFQFTETEQHDLMKYSFLCIVGYLPLCDTNHSSILNILNIEHHNSMPEHIDIGKKLMKNTYNEKILNNMLSYHHDDWKEDTPIEAQIYKLAEYYIYQLLYKKRDIFQAIRKISAKKSTLFNPLLIDVFLHEIDEITKITTIHLDKIDRLKNEN